MRNLFWFSWIFYKYNMDIISAQILKSYFLKGNYMGILIAIKNKFCSGSIIVQIDCYQSIYDLSFKMECPFLVPYLIKYISPEIWLANYMIFSSLLWIMYFSETYTLKKMSYSLFNSNFSLLFFLFQLSL